MDVKNWFKEKVFTKNFFTKKRIIILLCIVLAAVLVCVFLAKGGKKKEDGAQGYAEAQAAKQDISETIEQSGVIEPYERYEITSLVKGEIIS